MMMMTMDNAPLRCHILDFFNTNKQNTLHHWIEHVKTSMMVLFLALEMMFVAFFIAKSSLMCQNHQKETLS
jgi:hypothetical protein